MNSLNNARSNIYFIRIQIWLGLFKRNLKSIRKGKSPSFRLALWRAARRVENASPHQTQKEKTCFASGIADYTNTKLLSSGFTYSFKIFLLLICLQNVLQTNLVKILQNLCNFKFAGSQEKLVKHKFVSWCSH